MGGRRELYKQVMEIKQRAQRNAKYQELGGGRSEQDSDAERSD